MNQRLWRGISAALLTTTLGTTISINCPVKNAVASNPENKPGVNPEPINLVKVQEAQSQTARHKEENSIVAVYAHQVEGKPAATIYVRSIPLLTFLTSPTPEGATQDIARVDPVLRATTVAARIDQIDREKIDPKKIAVNWEEQSKSYSIKVDDRELVNIDSSTILADSTKDSAKDALSATNRLRRLLGDAPPLAEIIGQPKPKPKPVVAQAKPTTKRSSLKGIASWYGPGFHGRRSANGERFNQHAMTAAHRSLPFGTKVKVTNLNNGRSVVVRINDRGPFSGRRIIDLSAGAASSIGMIGSGTAPVALEVLGR
jgi:rare lipoprotein A